MTGSVALWPVRTLAVVGTLVSGPLSAQGRGYPIGEGLAAGVLSVRGAPDLAPRVARLRVAFETNDRARIERVIVDVDRWRSRGDIGAVATLVLADVFANLSLRDAPVLLSSGLREGESYADGTWRVLREGLRRFPRDLNLRQRFATLALSGQDRLPRPDQRAMLDGLLRAGQVTPDLLLLASRWHRLAGELEPATTILDAAILAGLDPGVGGLEGARLAMALGDSATATDLFWRGAEANTVAGRAAYRAVMRWVLDPDSVAVLDRVPGEDFPVWLRAFWTERDAIALKSRDGALREHLRRYQVALTRYRVTDPERRSQFRRVEYGFEGLADRCPGRGTELYALLARAQPSTPSDLRFREPLLDHRGLIYIRHGTPLGTSRSIVSEGLPPAVGPLNAEWIADVSTRLAAQVALSMQSNESWLYWIEGEWRMLHFRGSRAMGMSAPTTLSSVLPGGFDAWIARARLMPQYGAVAMRLLGRGTAAGPSELECEVKAASRAGSLLATRTDSDVPPLVRPWNAVVQVHSLGAEASDDGRAIVTFGIPVRALVSEDRGGVPVAAVRFEVRAFDRETGITVALDSVRRFRLPGPSKPADHLQGVFEVRLPPGEYAIAVRARQGDDSAGAYLARRNVRVPRGATAAVSDLLLGSGDGAGPITTREGPLKVNSLETWRAGDVVVPYIEVYGLQPEESYQVGVRLRHLDDRGQAPITLRADGVATRTVTAIRREIQLTGLKPGRVELTIEVTQGGVTLRRSRDLLIIE